MSYLPIELWKEATLRDANNPMRTVREEFYIPHENMIYLDGNSLGRLPKATVELTANVIEKQWGQQLIRSWNNDWYALSEKLSAKIAKIIGAQSDEVIVGDSTSINLFKLGFAALSYQQNKKHIITDNLNFPSDIYVLQGLIKIFKNQHQLEILESRDGIKIAPDEIDAALTKDTALVSLSHVLYKSAYTHPMQEITAMAHKHDALVLWDLSHSVGAVPVNLNQARVDMAIGCTYKYLNGGPGAPAFLYIRKDLQQHLMSPLQGWFGHASPFDFNLDYTPHQGIKRFLAGTPQVLSLSALEPGLDIILRTGMEKIRSNSIQLTEYLLNLVKKHLLPLGFSILSPEDFNQRGSHLSITHTEAYRISQALIDGNTGQKIIIPDFREPNIIRLGISPLYTTFTELVTAIDELCHICHEKSYLNFTITRQGVT